VNKAYLAGSNSLKTVILYIMSFSNTVQKLTEKILGSSQRDSVEPSLPAQGKRGTKTIDLPELSGSSRAENFSERLGTILSENEVEHQRRLKKLKKSIGSGEYGVDSKKVANSILDYPDRKE